MFGNCLVSLQSLSELFKPFHGIAGIQESCQVGGEAPEGQRDKSLMINGGWLRGVDLNDQSSGCEPKAA
jgi:hypothetical protein